MEAAGCDQSDSTPHLVINYFQLHVWGIQAFAIRNATLRNSFISEKKLEMYLHQFIRACVCIFPRHYLFQIESCHLNVAAVLVVVDQMSC